MVEVAFIVQVSHMPLLLLFYSRAPEIDMSELESLFSVAVPNSGPTKKSKVHSSIGPKSDKVQLVIELHSLVVQRVLLPIYII